MNKKYEQNNAVVQDLNNSSIHRKVSKIWIRVMSDDVRSLLESTERSTLTVHFWSRPNGKPYCPGTEVLLQCFA